MVQLAKLQPASCAITLELIVTVSSETGVRHTHTSFIRSLIFLEKTQCHGLADPQVVCKKGGSMETMEPPLDPPLHS